MIVRKRITRISGDNRFEAFDRLVVISHRTIGKSQIILYRSCIAACGERCTKRAESIVIAAEPAVNAARRDERSCIVRINLINFFVIRKSARIVARFDVHVAERKKHIAVFGIVF